MAGDAEARPVVVGKVRKPVGLRGEVTVEPTGDDPERFTPGAWLSIEGERERRYRIRSRRPVRGGVALQLEGIDDRDQAERLRGKLLYVRPEDLPALPEGVYYRYQLEGLQVVDAEGEVLGRVESILQTGANDVYCVRAEENEILIPAVREFVESVDLETGRIRLRVPRSALGEDENPI
ncbi:MAG: ribosome maturation factor RimM [Candidatus Eisenbacteria bacterium]|nr:ribosome maturation factor RimM [Candidatus Eisenbacteria bacterium]